jgi:hypothetical protein
MLKIDHFRKEDNGTVQTNFQINLQDMAKEGDNLIITKEKDRMIMEEEDKIVFLTLQTLHQCFYPEFLIKFNNLN